MTLVERYLVANALLIKRNSLNHRIGRMHVCVSIFVPKDLANRSTNMVLIDYKALYWSIVSLKSLFNPHTIGSQWLPFWLFFNWIVSQSKFIPCLPPTRSRSWKKTFQILFFLFYFFTPLVANTNFEDYGQCLMFMIILTK